MINYDFWYGHSLKDVDSVSVSFYPNEGIYRGNLYQNKKAIGDFWSCDGVEIESFFSGIFKK